MGMKCESCKIFDAAKGYAVCLNCIPETPKPKTVRVRVAVLVNVDGTWHADETAMGLIDQDDERVYYLTADLPIPEPQEVEAEVEEQD